MSYPQGRPQATHKDAKAQRTITENEIGKVVVDAVMAIHKALGSGLYEIVYEVVLTHEVKNPPAKQVALGLPL